MQQQYFLGQHARLENNVFAEAEVAWKWGTNINAPFYLESFDGGPVDEEACASQHSDDEHVHKHAQ